MADERQTIVARNNGAGILTVIAALMLVILLVWAFNGGLSFGSRGTIDIDVPAVTGTPDGQ